ncbi:MAG: molybdopterin molybdenumtransferase MoeA [Geminicoccaceae bacterium]|nr:MAG: molybdopterin molybdenumtransferase MoeA [Geminicoccaceae bacterium]
MIPVAAAEARICQALQPTPTEWVAIDQAFGRVLASDLGAGRDHPAAAISAMDGYAVRTGDLAAGGPLRVVQTAVAGQPVGAPLEAGTCARIFTGALIPPGADAILIQENARRDGDLVSTESPPSPGQFVRPAGLDFTAGAVLLRAGSVLDARKLGLAAAMGHGHVPVHRQPRVGIAGTGDELVRPGSAMAAHQIANSNALTIAGCVRAFGGMPVDLGIVRDDRDALGALLDAATGLDLLVTSGGASVGDHDLVAEVLGTRGFALDFWKIAMRPGKPLLFGQLRDVPVLGLPGNPVSTAVCCLVFLRPALARLQGQAPTPLPTTRLPLAAPLGTNDQRQDFVRARLLGGADGTVRVEPAPRQDSSMLATLALADALIVRPPHDPPRAADDHVDVVQLVRITGF